MYKIFIEIILVVQLKIVSIFGPNQFLVLVSHDHSSLFLSTIRNSHIFAIEKHRRNQRSIVPIQYYLYFHLTRKKKKKKINIHEYSLLNDTRKKIFLFTFYSNTNDYQKSKDNEHINFIIKIHIYIEILHYLPYLSI